MPFGNPHTYKGHSGVDFPGHAGEPIRASGPGRITTRGKNSRGGYYVWVQYDNGTRVGYHHMNGHESTPAVGHRVVEGSIIGRVGWSGNVRPAGRAGAHLHSEVYGHATTAGYWQHFDPDRVVGQPAPSTITEQEHPDMFIAIVRRKDWYLVVGGKACLLGAASGARDSGAPILEFVDDWAVKQLQGIVTGIK